MNPTDMIAFIETSCDSQPPKYAKYQLASTRDLKVDAGGY